MGSDSLNGRKGLRGAFIQKLVPRKTRASVALYAFNFMPQRTEVTDSAGVLKSDPCQLRISYKPRAEAIYDLLALGLQASLFFFHCVYRLC
jgi:hypothetical protein